MRSGRAGTGRWVEAHGGRLRRRGGGGAPRHPDAGDRRRVSRPSPGAGGDPRPASPHRCAEWPCGAHARLSVRRSRETSAEWTQGLSVALQCRRWWPQQRCGGFLADRASGRHHLARRASPARWTASITSAPPYREAGRYASRDSDRTSSRLDGVRATAGGGTWPCARHAPARHRPVGRPESFGRYAARGEACAASPCPYRVARRRGRRVSVAFRRLTRHVCRKGLGVVWLRYNRGTTGEA